MPAEEKLKSKLSSIVDFAFKGGVKIFINFSNNNDPAYWGGRKQKRNLVLAKHLCLITAINHFIKNCYFNVGNATVKQATDIPLGIDLALVLGKYFFYISNFL